MVETATSVDFFSCVPGQAASLHQSSRSAPTALETINHLDSTDGRCGWTFQLRAGVESVPVITVVQIKPRQKGIKFNADIRRRFMTVWLDLVAFTWRFMGSVPPTWISHLAHDTSMKSIKWFSAYDIRVIQLYRTSLSTSNWLSEVPARRTLLRD